MARKEPRTTSCLSQDMLSLTSPDSVSFALFKLRDCSQLLTLLVFLDLEGKWGIRIKSVLAVQRAKVNPILTLLHSEVMWSQSFQMDADSQNYLSFVRLTCVPIQTRMVIESMLTKEEKTWIKEHNQQCYNKVEPFLEDDKRALEWLDRQRKRGILDKFVFPYK
jgi:hypothetical protein